MNKIYRVFIIFSFLLLLVGCRRKETLSCRYSESYENQVMDLEMQFLKEKYISSGKLTMRYDLSKLSNRKEIINKQFKNTCDNIGENYSNCSVKETNNGVDVSMNFNLDSLEKNSNGSFNKEMNLEELEDFIKKRFGKDKLECSIN